MAGAYEILGIKKNATESEIRCAYRELARRWHPDRFPDGPERLWAEQKMTAINIAYHEAMEALCASGDPVMAAEDDEQFADARRLLELGQVSAARQALMRITSRSAEWNYLFGATLLRQGEYEKAVLYFGIAARQQPRSKQYRTAYVSAAAIRDQKNGRPFLAKVRSVLFLRK